MRVRASLSRSRWYGWSDRAQDQCHCISDTVLRVFASLLRLSGLGQNFRHIFEVRTEELSTHESREGYTYLFSRTSLESLDCKHLLKGRMTNGLNDWLIDKYLKSKCDLLRCIELREYILSLLFLSLFVHDFITCYEELSVVRSKYYSNILYTKNYKYWCRFVWVTWTRNRFHPAFLRHWLLHRRNSILAYHSVI